MASIKSFTDISQSKKLAEILPLESADYHYIAQGEKSYFYPYSLSSDAVKDYDEEIKYIPCWSLTALLKVMPFWYDIHPVKNGVAIKCDYGKEKIVISDNHIDACVEMIIKLHELNLL